MEYEVEVDGQKHRVRMIERDGKLHVEHDGTLRPVSVETPLRSKIQVAQLNGSPLRFGYHHGKEGTSIVLDGVIYTATVRELEHARLAAVSRRRQAGGNVEVKAPMPGMVVAIRVQVGELVKKNQSLLNLHAMKLENDIRSTRDGIVQAVLVKPNDVLEKGAIMIKLGPAPEQA